MKINQNFPARQILVIGGNGGIGKQCIRVALEAGHHVTAILRTPSKLSIIHPNLKIEQGDINNPASITCHIGHKDVVISAVGASGGLFGDKPTTLYSDTAKVILDPMNSTNAAHTFFISASAVEISPVLPFFVRLIARYVLQKLLKHMYSDLLKMEQLVKNSPTNWTIIRPPQLTDGPETGNYRTAANQFLPNALKISRADVAHFIINHIDDSEISQTTVEIGY